MATFQFDTAGINPNFGGGAPSLPPGKHPVKIVDSEFKPDRNGNTMLVLEMEAVGGPAQGGKQRLNLNVSSASETAKRIAYEQLAAICSVVGIPAFTDTRALHEKPFIVEIVPQKETEATKGKGYVEVSAVFDINGGKPGQAAQPQANVSPAFAQPAAAQAPAPSFAPPQVAPQAPQQFAAPQAPAFAPPPSFAPPAAPAAAFGGGAPTQGFAPPPTPGKMPWQ